jgi:hypothetical protein
MVAQTLGQALDLGRVEVEPGLVGITIYVVNTDLGQTPGNGAFCRTPQAVRRRHRQQVVAAVQGPVGGST